MAITRVTDAQIIYTAPAGTSIITGFDAARIERLDSGRMIVAWDTALGTDEFLAVTTLNATGTAPAPVVNLASVPSSRYIDQPEFASTLNGDALLVWNNDAETEGATTGDTQCRTLTGGGTPGAAAFDLSTAPGGGETTASITRLSDGNFLAVWSDSLATSGLGVTTDIMGRVFNASGAALGGEFTINAETSGLQLGTDVETLGDGRAVAVWATGSLGFSGFVPTGIKGRFLSANGTPTGTEFEVDTVSGGITYEVKTIDIVTLGNGGFVVFWEEDAGAPERIYFQRFNADGSKAGAQTLIDDPNGTQNIFYFFATEQANGGFSVGWRRTGGNGPESHFIRQFDMNGTEIGSQASLDTIATAAGIERIYDMELMSDGRAMLFGYKGLDSVATQILDMGDRILRGSAAGETLYGKHGVNDVIAADAGNDTIFGFSGNDAIDGGAGTDAMTGGGGNDTYTVDAVGDTATETDAAVATGGNDLIQSSLSWTLGANIERLTLTGSGAINGTGNGLANTLIGNSGANILNGGAAGDAMIGGDGSDTYYVDATGDTVTESNANAATGGTDRVNATVTHTLANNVENLALGGTAGINGTGNGLANLLTGNGANNTLSGLGGNDTLIGGAGADTMIGGDGNDLYSVDNQFDIVTESNANALTGGTDRVISTIGAYTLTANVESLTLSGAAAVTGNGNALANTLVGNALSNTLRGFDGNDVLDGGAAADRMDGGNGNDRYYVDTAGEIIIEINADRTTGGNDGVFSSVSHVLAANVENLTLTGAGAINATGNAITNWLVGNAAANELNGGLASDILTGGGGLDFFVFNTALGVANRDSITDFSVADDTIRLENAIFTGLGAATGVLAASAFWTDTTGLAHDADDRIIYNAATGHIVYDADGTGATAGITFATLTTKPTGLTNADFVVI